MPLPPSSNPSAMKPTSKKSTGEKPAHSGGPRFATLSDLNRSSPAPGPSHRHGDSDDDDDGDYDPLSDQPPDFFTGGEKSGLAVQNPNNRDRGHSPGGTGMSLVPDILRQAAEETARRKHGDGPSANSADSSDESDNPATDRVTRSGRRGAQPPSRFTGSGQTLGSEDVESVLIPDPAAQPAAEPGTIRRHMTFWREGFSVGDGPLMRYDDPANREVLAAIHQGRAPYSIMDVEPGQAADVEVHQRMNEDYPHPPKRTGGFAGSGTRLGSEVPAFSTPAAAAPAPAPARGSRPAATAGTSAQSGAVTVDEALPTVTLQIRRADGTRLTSRFNTTHTIADVRAFVNGGDPDSAARSWVLMTTFPIQRLEDWAMRLEDVSVLKKGGTVLQRWV